MWPTLTGTGQLPFGQNQNQVEEYQACESGNEISQTPSHSYEGQLQVDQTQTKVHMYNNIIIIAGGNT